jgi:5-methylcytosine-specific restriction endonuclease McrA
MRETEKNPEYRRIITGKRWQKLRGSYMLLNAIRNGGFCEQCVKDYFVGGPRPRKATEVHHIVPIESATSRQDMEALAYDENNLIALCSECHHEAHRRLGNGHIKEAIEDDITRRINEIKNGIREEGV